MRHSNVGGKPFEINSSLISKKVSFMTANFWLELGTSITKSNVPE